VTGPVGSADLGADRGTLTAADGVRLAVRRWTAGGAPRGVGVAMAHGLAGRKDAPELVAVAERLRADGYEVIAHDSRGHGGSDGSCTLGHDEALDVAAVVDELRQRVDRVVLVGASMGAIAVLRAASDDRTVDGVVVVSSPAWWRIPRSLSGVAAVALTQTGPGRALARRRMGVALAPAFERGAPPEVLAARLAAPLAIVHGLRDRFLPVRAAERLAAVARDPWRLDLVAEMGHGFHAAAVEPIASAVDWALSVPVPAR
jgi:pimeloyl-ACP methyl ester carboxylesterase